MKSSSSSGTPPASPESSNYSSSDRSFFVLYCCIFILIGVGALLWMFLSIFHDPAINLAVSGQAVEGEQPSLVIAFLTQYGLILPVLIISSGFALIWLGYRFLARSVVIARWGQSVLLWLMVGAVILTAAALVTTFTAVFSPPDSQPVQAEAAGGFAILLPGAAALIAGVGFWGLRRRGDSSFSGQETLKSREVRTAWNLLVPTLVVFVLVAARPLEQTFIRSLTDKRFAGQGVPNYVGLDNYRNLLTFRLDVVECRVEEDTDGCKLAPNGSVQWESIDRDLLEEGFRTAWNIPIPFSERPASLAVSGLSQDFLRSIGTTLLFTVFSVTLELLVALFMALTVNSQFAGRGLMRTVMLIPWAVPTVISARLWELMLKDSSAGIINRILTDVGLIEAPQAWLSTTSLQLPAAIMVDVWKTAPFMALLLLAGLQTISQDLYESSSVDGANGIQQLFSITLPLLRPTIAVALVFRTLDALRVFDLFNVLFKRQQLTMATYNFEMLVNNQRDGYASAISIVIFILISIFAFLYVRMLKVETNT